MDADLRADRLPGTACNRKIRVVHHNDEVRIAGGDFDARNLNAVGES